jgi:hypothetical protein
MQLRCAGPGWKRANRDEAQSTPTRRNRYFNGNKPRWLKMVEAGELNSLRLLITRNLLIVNSNRLEKFVDSKIVDTLWAQ